MMTAPADIRAFAEIVQRHLPAAEVTFQAPRLADGRWWLDLASNEDWGFELSWTQSSGFEFYPMEEPDFGLKPELAITSPDAAWSHLSKIVEGQRVDTNATSYAIAASVTR